MRLIHKTNGQEEEKNVGPLNGLMTTNRNGDYFWVSDRPTSRYQGWFFRKDKDLFRIIESIEVEGAGPADKMVNGFDYGEIHREGIKEVFFLPHYSHTLVYELSEERKVNVFFDVRHSYSSKEGESCKIEERNGTLLLSFENGIFVAVRAKEKELKEEKVHRFYEYDKKRGSPPYERDVFLNLSLYGKKFVFSVAKTEEEAIKEVNKIFARSYPSLSDELDLVCAKRTLSDLLVLNDPGLYAGLPWFFQFWPRDEAVSLKALAEVEEEKARAILHRLVRFLESNGPRNVVNADAPGWVVKRFEELNLRDSEKERLFMSIRSYLEDLLLHYTDDGFAVNGPKETWMDTLERSGARIEIQAMRLNMYKVAASLSETWQERRFYRKLEKDLKKRVRRNFFDGNILYDGYFPQKKEVDDTIRPNIFIAAYIYPELLTRREWIKCFDKALSVLWLPWGGLSTVNVNSSSFKVNHTGESPESYHNGDSWFYINNIAAIMLYRANKRRYASYIRKIMQASKREMMWMGVAGRSGEVSSAKWLFSEGSPVQAWSAATYIEAAERIRGI